MLPLTKSLSQNPHGGVQRPEKLERSNGFGTCSKWVLLFGLVGGIVIVAALLPATAPAQVPFGVTTFYPPQPVVTYFPERRGVLFPRIVYRPAVSYVPAVPVPVTTYYAPATNCMPPVAPIVRVPAPVTTYYAPAPVLPYYLPRIRY